MRALWLKIIKINLTASTITGDFKVTLRGVQQKKIIFFYNYRRFRLLFVGVLKQSFLYFFKYPFNITGDLNGVLKGSLLKIFKHSLNKPSIVTDIKTSKWEGEEVKFIKIINVPLIVLESYNAFVYPYDEIFPPFNSNGDFNSVLRGCCIIFYFPSIVLEFSTAIWWGASITFLYLPSIVTGNLDSYLYTQTLKNFKFNK